MKDLFLSKLKLKWERLNYETKNSVLTIKRESKKSDDFDVGEDKQSDVIFLKKTKKISTNENYLNGRGKYYSILFSLGSQQ